MHFNPSSQRNMSSKIKRQIIYVCSFVLPSNIITFTRRNQNVPEQFSCFDADWFLTKNSLVALSVPFAITDRCKRMAKITISLYRNVVSISELLEILLSVVHRHPGIYNCIFNVVSRLFVFIQFQSWSGSNLLAERDCLHVTAS